jgi:hypothetical protein
VVLVAAAAASATHAMKVDALKAYLREHGLPLAGAKFDLVARCAAHARGDLLDGPQRTAPPARMVPKDAVDAKYLALKIPQLQVKQLPLSLTLSH